MTALRFCLLLISALSIAAVGALLWFTPIPVAFSQPVDVADALLASGASLGLGALMPQLDLASRVVDSGSGPGPVLLAFSAPATATPVPTGTPAPTSTPTDTSTPTQTYTPAPTRTRAPTSTPVSLVLGGCGNVDQPGTYLLGNSLTANGDCLNLRADNIVLDCGGQSITGTALQGYGVVVRTVGLIPRRPNNIQIRGCRISGFRYGIYVEGSTNAYIHDNVSSGNFSDVDGRRYGQFLGMAEGGGIRLNNSVGARVENNTTTDEAIGIDIRGSSGVSVRGNQSSNNTAWGINLWQTSGSEVSANTTGNNIRYCTWGGGMVGAGCDAGGIVMQYGSSGNLVTGNNVTSGNGNGIFIKAHAMPCGNNNTIANNTINGSLYNSIEVGFCSGTQIVGNRMNEGKDGIWMGFTVGGIIKNNVIQNQSNHGIISNHSHDNTIANNTLVNDNEAIYLYWEQVNPNDFRWLDVSSYRSYNNNVANNTMTNNYRAGLHLKNSTSNQVTGNTLYGNGRNYLLEGDTSGNNISGNNPDAWLPGLLLAFRFPR